MRRERADKFIGKLVKVTFKEEWYNEATNSNVSNEEEYTGVLKFEKNDLYKWRYYFLDTPLEQDTNDASWTANAMKKIEELL